VGKSIWESIWRVKHGKKIGKDEFRYGWQEESESMGESEGWEGTKVFVACSTSGLSASLLPAEKERIWRELGVWVERRREERAGIKIEEAS
jgi:thymine-DNA glycosylase